MTRTNVPTSYTTMVHQHGLDIPNDTMTFNFYRTPMAADDVATAMVASFFEATQLLSLKFGDENQIVIQEEYINRDDYYELEVGADLYAEEGSFKLWQLRIIIQTIFSMSYRFNMRECSFSYRSMDVTLAQGHLKNPTARIPACEIAPDHYLKEIFGGYVECSSYGRRMSFEVVAVGMMHILNYGWNEMVKYGQSNIELLIPDGYYGYLMPGLRFEARAVNAGQFMLEYLLNAAYAVLTFGRIFHMRVLKLVINTAEHERVQGFVARVGPLSGANLTSSQ